METQKQNEKMVTILIAGLVLILAVFGSEFRSHGESANTTVERNEVWTADLDRENLFTEVLFELDEPALKTAKLYNEEGQLLEMLILTEEESIDEVYVGKLFNRASFLSGYGNVSIYQVSE